LAKRRGVDLAGGVLAPQPFLLAHVPGRHHDVDAVGLALDVLVDPAQLDLELLGREGEGAEHPHAAGPAHRDHYVATVAEGEDRDVHSESVAELGAHEISWSGAGQAPRERSKGGST